MHWSFVRRGGERVFSNRWTPRGRGLQRHAWHLDGCAGRWSPHLSHEQGPRTRLFADTFNLTFGSGGGSPTAVGFDVFPGPVFGNVAITVFSPTNALLGTFVIPDSIGGTFFGVVDVGDSIGRVTIDSQAAVSGELIDNLAFGTAAAVPEPASLTLLGLGLAGCVARYRRRTR